MSDNPVEQPVGKSVMGDVITQDDIVKSRGGRPRKEGKKPTVWVGCKLPHGHEIQLEREISSRDANGKDVVLNVPDGEPVVLAGANADRKRTDPNDMSSYGITEVDADLMNHWMDTHKAFPAVVKGLIFIAPTEADAEDEAADREKVITGVEGLDISGRDPRIGGGIQADNYEGKPEE